MNDKTYALVMKSIHTISKLRHAMRTAHLAEKNEIYREGNENVDTTLKTVAGLAVVIDLFDTTMGVLDQLKRTKQEEEQAKKKGNNNE